MPKRFIDTGFLSQTWIRKLTPEQKCFLIYLMLECDNGGIIDLDIEAAEFWIGKKIGDPTKFLPNSYLIFIKESDKYFLPKFIFYQYGDLSSNKNIVNQARQILEKHGLINEDFTLKLPKDYLKDNLKLPKSQVTSNSKGIGIGIGNGNSKNKEGKKLFKNSGITKEDIENAFKKTEDLVNADPKHYFNRMLDASESKGLMYTDWIATARSWARRDLAEDKLVLGKLNRPKIEY